MLHALAAEVLAFRRALEPGPGQGKARAWAMVVLRELCWACLQHASIGNQESASTDHFAVVADILELFVTQTR